MTHPPAHQRRAVDFGPLKRLRAFWARWGGLIGAGWLFVVTVVLLWVAVSDYNSHVATERAAKANCQRARAYGPSFATFLERERAFPAPVLKSYRLTIPKTCPGDRAR